MAQRISTKPTTHGRTQPRKTPKPLQLNKPPTQTAATETETHKTLNIRKGVAQPTSAKPTTHGRNHLHLTPKSLQLSKPLMQTETWDSQSVWEQSVSHNGPWPLPRLDQQLQLFQRVQHDTESTESTVHHKIIQQHLKNSTSTTSPTAQGQKPKAKDIQHCGPSQSADGINVEDGSVESQSCGLKGSGADSLMGGDTGICIQAEKHSPASEEAPGNINGLTIVTTVGSGVDVHSPDQSLADKHPTSKLKQTRPEQTKISSLSKEPKVPAQGIGNCQQDQIPTFTDVRKSLEVLGFQIMSGCNNDLVPPFFSVEKLREYLCKYGVPLPEGVDSEVDILTKDQAVSLCRWIRLFIVTPLYGKTHIPNFDLIDMKEAKKIMAKLGIGACNGGYWIPKPGNMIGPLKWAQVESLIATEGLPHMVLEKDTATEMEKIQLLLYITESLDTITFNPCDAHALYNTIDVTDGDVDINQDPSKVVDMGPIIALPRTCKDDASSESIGGLQNGSHNTSTRVKCIIKDTNIKKQLRKEKVDAVKPMVKWIVKKPKINDRFRLKLDDVKDLFGYCHPSWFFGTVTKTADKAHHRGDSPTQKKYLVNLLLDFGMTFMVEYPSKGVERLVPDCARSKYYTEALNENSKFVKGSLAYDACPKDLGIGDLVDCHSQCGPSRRGRIASVDHTLQTCDVAFDTGEYECCVPTSQSNFCLVENGLENLTWLQPGWLNGVCTAELEGSGSRSSHTRWGSCNSGDIITSVRITADIDFNQPRSLQEQAVIELVYTNGEVKSMTYKELALDVFAAVKEGFNGTEEIKKWPCAVTDHKPHAIVLQYMPLLVFEQTKSTFNDRMPKGNITEEGQLHESRISHIEAVHICEPAYQQVYLVRLLGQSPHYHVSREGLHEFEAKANMLFPSKVCNYSGKDTFVNHENDFLKIVNHGTPEFESIRDIFGKLDFHNLAREILSDKASCDRGNLQISVGFTGTQCYVLDEDTHVQRPALKPSTSPAWATRLQLLTQLVDKVSSPSNGPLFTDTYRNNKFAFKIMEKMEVEKMEDSVVVHNRLEGGTGAISDQEHMVVCHLDVNNDDMTPGFEYVICASQMIYLVDRFVRVAILGYSRRSCLLFCERLELQAGRAKVITTWQQAQPSPATTIWSWLDDPSLKSSLPQDQMLPSHYSCFAYMIRCIQEKYDCSFRKMIEALFPVSFLDCPDVYWSIMTGWLNNGLPNKNLSLAFLEEATRQYSHLRRKRGNKDATAYHLSLDLTENALNSRLNELYSALQNANLGDTYKYVANACANRKGKGLAASRVLGVAALAGMITTADSECPPDADMIDWCTAMDTVVELFRQTKGSGSFLKHLSNAWDLPRLTVESLLSRYYQNCGGSKLTEGVKEIPFMYLVENQKVMTLDKTGIKAAIKQISWKYDESRRNRRKARTCMSTQNSGETGRQLRNESTIHQATRKK